MYRRWLAMHASVHRFRFPAHNQGWCSFVVLDLIMLWRTAHRSHLWWSCKLLVGTMLMGFGIFNLVDGIIDHQILGLHHVNERVP